MKKYQIIGLVFIALSVSSCEKILEQEPQGSLDVTDDPFIYTTRDQLEAGVIGTYDILQNGNYHGLRYFVFSDMSADNINHTGTFPSFADIFNNNIFANNIEVENMWTVIYNGINRANNVIASAPGITDPADPAFNFNIAIAEARFLRAVFYFDLIRYFGGSETGYNKPNGLGVPLFLTPTRTPEDAAPKPRSTEAEVYAQIIADLDFAIANLPLSAADGLATRDAANFMKARLQLYREQWDDAEALATAVLSQFQGLANGGLAANYADLWVFKNTSPESVWELQFFADDANAVAFFYYPTGFGGRNEISSSTSLRDAHTTGDLRRPVNFTVASAGVPANETAKYTDVGGTDNVIMLRLAELYLIRSEARLRKAAPNLTGALADLNLVRTRAGLANTTAVSAADILLAIERERRVELAHEGHRWFDLRRYNRLSTVGITQPFRSLFPIPQDEVLTSGGVVVQNTGY